MTIVVTRFAPSPTGFLHVGSARTAIFNWLYARHHHGKFLLRIEDTDRARSTQEAIDAILESMKWLGLTWDEEVVFQFSRAERHQEIARELLARGKAYYCFCSPEELEAMREQARAEGRQPRYNGYWRDRSSQDAPAGVPPVVRLKAPLEGETLIQDLVQGDVRVQNSQLDDMILLRADGTPTYMLSVVVDDHDMGITHIIRGDDHLTNAFRQKHIYEAMGWDAPLFSHIPLIHGADGAKLSKRHGALGIEAYRDMGFLPEALVNYLLRLGWGHGDDEIISRTQAIEWFEVKDVGRAAARFDLAKLTSLNAHYLREKKEEELLVLLEPFLSKRLTFSMTEVLRSRLIRAMLGLKQRARTLEELADNALFLISSRPLKMDEKAQALLTPEARSVLEKILETFEALPQWEEGVLEETLKTLAETLHLKMGALAQPLRAALTGHSVSPGIFDLLMALGREEALGRLQDVIHSS